VDVFEKNNFLPAFSWLSNNRMSLNQSKGHAGFFCDLSNRLCLVI